MKHVYGDLIPLVGELSKLAKRRAIPVEAMIIDRILLDMAAIIAGKDKLIVKALKV